MFRISTMSLSIAMLIWFAASAQVVTFVSDDFSANQVGVTTTGDTITPKYSRNNTVWIVEEGLVATDGTSVGNREPTAGSLNLGCSGNTTVTLPWGDVDAGPASIEFTLRQSNGTSGNHRFDLTVKDTTGHTYRVSMSPNRKYFGASDSGSGFAILDNPPYLVSLTGAALSTEEQVLRHEFDPATGFELWSSAHPEAPVLRFANVHDSIALRSISFTSLEPCISWFLDNVTVRADELTADEIARAEAEKQALAAAAARHEDFRRRHHVRSPHPQWMNSLRPGADGGPAMLIADDYKARYVVLLPAEPSAGEELAAKELVLWLKMMSGADFSVITDGAEREPSANDHLSPEMVARGCLGKRDHHRERLREL